MDEARIHAIADVVGRRAENLRRLSDADLTFANEKSARYKRGIAGIEDDVEENLVKDYESVL